MAATLTREEMFAEIVRQDEMKLDLVSDTRRMSTATSEGVATLHIDRPEGEGVSFNLNSHALGQISGDLKIPKTYFDRMRVEAPGLFDQNVNHWLANQPERKLVRGFRSPDGGTGIGRAWLSDRYKRIDTVQIARHIFPEFDKIPGLTFHQAQLTDERFYLRALLPSLQAEIKVGDVVQAGVAIRNSEVGSGMLRIEPFVWRLICLNGMTVPDSAFTARHVGRKITDEDMTIYADDTLAADDQAFWLKARDQVKAALTEVRFHEIVGQLREITTGETIVAPVAATETLANRFGFTESEREALLKNLVTEGDLSQWGMLNAVTATAKEAEGFDRQHEMEAMGWDIAQITRSEWSKIATVA